MRWKIEIFVIPDFEKASERPKGGNEFHQKRVLVQFFNKRTKEDESWATDSMIDHLKGSNPLPTFVPNSIMLKGLKAAYDQYNEKMPEITIPKKKPKTVIGTTLPYPVSFSRL